MVILHIEATIIAKSQQITTGLLEKGKVMLEVFFNWQGIVPHKSVPESAAVMKNAAKEGVLCG
jgi:hypothetical protein